MKWGRFAGFQLTIVDSIVPVKLRLRLDQQYDFSTGDEMV